MKAAVTDARNFLGRELTILQEKGDFHLREQAWEHLALKVFHQEFEGQTKTGLGHLEVRRIVEQVAQEMLTNDLERHPNAPEAILSKALQASRATMISKKERVLVRRENISNLSMLPGKLSV